MAKFMSAWYFTEDATVWPYLGRDDLTLQDRYGEPFSIKCGIEGRARESRDRNGQEFIVSTTYHTGTPINIQDRIARGKLDGPAQGEIVRNVRRHGMGAFGYDDEYEVEV